MPDLKPSVLRTQLAKLRKRSPGAGVYALRCRRQWSGGERLQVDDATYRVVQSSSELALREAVATAGASGEPLVLLTDANEATIGKDLLARFARARVERLDDWQTVHDAFGTSGVDSRLNRCPWLIELLAQNMPDKGYAPAPNGTLTLDLATGAFLQAHLQFPDMRPDARHVLLWSRNKSTVQGYLALAENQRADVQEWVAASAGPLGRFLMQVLATGDAADLVVCGLCCEVLFSDQAEGKLSLLREATIRLERFTGHLPVPHALGVDWAREAVSALHDIEAKDGAEARNVVALQLDRLLGELGIAEHAWLSSISPNGFEQRMARFGGCLVQRLRKSEAADPAVLAAFAEQVAAHRQADTAPERVQRVRMARRLCDWLAVRKMPGAQAPATLLPALAGQYTEETGLVDLAREALLPGDACQELSAAYRALLNRVGEIREDINRAFGEALAGYVAADVTAPDCLNIEDTLRRVVAPVARENPVLILVMDGMGMAVFRSLLEDLLARFGWIELGPETGTWPLPVIAALPTVTQVSRAALLGGCLPADTSPREAEALAANADLRGVCGSHPPILFSKRDLLAAGGLELATGVTDALQDSKRRVVAAIINAVDDQLPHGDQIVVSWRVHSIPVLEKLFHAAHLTERTVIMISDHGHVRDVETTLTTGEDAQRFRPATEPPQEGEVLVRGRRVCVRDGAIVAPWTERMRYGRKQHGYHGGVTPQEVIVPLAVLSHGVMKLKGWEQRVRLEPTWWTGALPSPKKQIVPVAQELEPLFAHAEMEKPVADWFDALWQSPVMAQQLLLAPRAAPSPERARPVLEALASHGGSMLLSALARHVDQPSRLRGLIAVLKQVLNVDGYPVLTHDTASETVVLDMPLLRRQFEISP